MTTAIQIMLQKQTLMNVYNGKQPCALCGETIVRTDVFYITFTCMHAFCNTCASSVKEDIATLPNESNAKRWLCCPKQDCDKAFTKIIKCDFKINPANAAAPEPLYREIDIFEVSDNV